MIAIYKAVSLGPGSGNKMSTLEIPETPLADTQPIAGHSTQTKFSPAKSHGSLGLKDLRRNYYSQEKEKAALSSHQARAWIREQKQRQKHLQQHIDQFAKAVQEEEEIQAALRDEAAHKHQTRLAQGLEKLQQQKKRRLQAQEELKNKQTALVASKPRHVRLYEKYQQECELPALEERKAQLAKLRMMSSPIRREDLQAHMKNYNEFKRQQEEKLRKNMHARKLDQKVAASTLKFSSSLGARLVQQDKVVVNQKKLDEQLRVERTKRRLNYASLVKEVHLPTTTRKARSPGKRRSPRKLSPTKRVRSVEELKPWKPHTFAKNSMVPEPSPKRLGVVVDYLAERRAERTEAPAKNPINWNSVTGPNKLKKIKALSSQVEREVSKKEVIAEAGLNFKAIQASEEANEILVSSIKAKLSLLEQISD